MPTPLDSPISLVFRGLRSQEKRPRDPVDSAAGTISEKRPTVL